MAISNPTLLDTQTLLTAGQLNSASISPSANALLVIVHTVLASSGSGWTDAVSDSFGANLGDWTSVGVEIDGAATVHMWLHYAQCGATPGSGTVSVDPSGGTKQIMFVLEVTGHNTTSPVTQYKTYSSDATPTSPEITLDSSPASGSLVLGAIGGGPGTTSSGATSGTGFTELADTRVAAPRLPVTSCAVQYDNGSADTTCDWSLSNYGQTITGIALEIAAADSGGTAHSAAATLANHCPNKLPPPLPSGTAHSAAATNGAAVSGSGDDPELPPSGTAHSAAATLANTSEMTGAGLRKLGTSSTFTTTSEMTAAGIRGLGAAAALTLTSEMTAAGIRALAVSTLLAMTSTMTANAGGSKAHTAEAALSITSEMTGAGIRGIGAAATLPLTSTMTAAAIRGLYAAAALTTTSEMTAAAIRGLYASVAFGTTSEMTAAGIRTLGTSAALALTTAATAAGTRQLGAAGQLDITSEMTATGSTGSSLSANLVLTSVMTALGWILAKGAGARVPYNVANRPTNGTTTRTSATTNNRDAYEVSHRVTHEADTRGEVEIEY